MQRWTLLQPGILIAMGLHGYLLEIRDYIYIYIYIYTCIYIMGCTGTSRFLIDLKIGKSSIKMTETVSAKWIFHCQPKLPRRSCDAQAQAMDRPVVRLTAMATKGWCSKLIMTLIVNDVNDSVYLIESGWIMCVSLLYQQTCQQSAKVKTFVFPFQPRSCKKLKPKMQAPCTAMHEGRSWCVALTYPFSSFPVCSW